MLFKGKRHRMGENIQNKIHVCFLSKGGREEERGFPSGSEIKNPPAAAGDMGSIPDLERPPRSRATKPGSLYC